MIGEKYISTTVEFFFLQNVFFKLFSKRDKIKVKTFGRKNNIVSTIVHKR